MVVDYSNRLSRYRIRGPERAGSALTGLTDRLASPSLPELQTSAAPSCRWRRQILPYFGTGRTEGSINKAKLVP